MKQPLIRYFVVLFIVMQAMLSHAANLSLSADTIPFERTAYNNLLVSAVLNRVDTVKLMFHTASKDVTLTQTSLPKLKSIRFDEEVDGVTSWGAASNASRMSAHNHVQLQGISWPDLPIWDDVNTGQGADGKLGFGLLEGKVLQLDFDQNLMMLTDELPLDLSSYQQLPLTFEKGNMFVTIHCSIGGKRLENRFLIHSGYSGALLFDDEFVVKHDLDSLLPAVGEKILHDAFGNAIVSKKVVVPRAEIGSHELIDVAAGFFKGASGLQRISILGADVLKRFNVVIDAQRTFIYIKPSHLIATAFTVI